jgi:hypothetical protein
MKRDRDFAEVNFMMKNVNPSQQKFTLHPLIHTFPPKISTQNVG